MNIRLRLSLYKSFIRERRSLIAFMCLSAISAFVIMSYAYMVNLIEDINHQQFEKDCGRMDIHVIYNEDFIRDRVLSHKNVYDYYEYYRESKYIEDKDNYYAFLYCDEGFFQYSSYKCLMGEFPVSDEEIMCEPWFLRSIGISTDNMIGASIELEGKKYIVSGLIVDKSYGEADIKNAIFIKAAKSEQKYNSMMIDLDCDVTDELKEEFFRYTLDSEKYSSVSNNVAKQLAISGIKESTGVVFVFVFLVLFISSIMIIYNYMLLYINHVTDNINNYLRLGLSKFAIMSAISSVICTVIALFNLVGAACYNLFSEYIYKYVVQRDKINYEYIVSDSITEEMLELFVYLTVIEVLLVTLKMVRIFYGKTYIKDGKFGKVYNINPKSYNERKTFLSMARNNLRMSRSNNIVTVLALSISICAYLASVYYVDNIDGATIDYDDVKYIVKMPGNQSYDEKRQQQKVDLVNKMLEDERFDAIIRNVYYTKSNIDISKISDDFTDYLKLYYEYNAMLGNKFTREIPLNIAVMSLEQIGEDMGIKLENNQGIFFNTSTCYEIKNAIDISVGDKIRLLGGDKEEIEIVKIDNSKSFNIFSSEICLVLVVNNDTFNKLSGEMTPERIYITRDVSEEFLIDYLEDFDFVQIERLGFDNQTVNVSATEAEIILFLILCVCAAVLFISLMISCNTRIKVFSKEYKTLFSIGIPLKCVIRVPIYEMCIIMAEIIGVSLIATFISTNIAYQLSTVKIMYSFPIMDWIKTLVIVSIFVFICIAYNVREFIKIEKK